MCARLLLMSLCVLLPLAGCAKQQQTATLSAPVATAPAAVDPAAAANPPSSGDDALLPSDPIADQAPMPVAELTRKRLIAQLPESAAGFLKRGSITVVSEPGYSGYTMPRQHPVTYEAVDLYEPVERYEIDSGDRVRVFVYGQPSLSRIYPVDSAGRIHVPLIGSVNARGLTTRNLARSIAAKLGTQYVRNPEVSVEVAQYRPFYILGEVRNAGQFPWVSGMTVQTAVAIAGGYTPRATQRHVTLTRRADGLATEMSVPTSYVVLPGDTIYVEERFF